MCSGWISRQQRPSVWISFALLERCSIVVVTLVGRALHIDFTVESGYHSRLQSSACAALDRLTFKSGPFPLVY